MKLDKSVVAFLLLLFIVSIGIGVVGSAVLLGGSQGENATQDASGQSLTQTAQPAPVTDDQPVVTSAAGESFAEHREDLRLSTEDLVEIRDYTITENGTIHLSYVSTNATKESVSQNEIETVAGAYAREVGQGWNVGRLQVTVYYNGSAIVSYQIRPGWGEDFANGDIEASEYLSKIYDTFGPPETPTSSS